LKKDGIGNALFNEALVGWQPHQEKFVRGDKHNSAGRRAQGLNESGDIYPHDIKGQNKVSARETSPAQNTVCPNSQGSGRGPDPWGACGAMVVSGG
jgi:hypothetical protein